MTSFPSLEAASPPSDDSAENDDRVIPEEEGFTSLILSSSQLAEEGSWVHGRGKEKLK
jgi:hypothetical protein